CRARHRSLPGDRAAEGRQSAWSNRTAGAQAPPQTLPVAEGATRESPAAGALAWLSSKPFIVSKCHVRRENACTPCGWKTRPATVAPAGSNRSSRRGNEAAEA